MSTATGAIPHAAEAAPKPTAAESSAKWSFVALTRVGGIAFQLGLLILITRTFRIENKGFMYMLAYASAGFIVHHFLPHRYRLPFFAVLSIGCIGLVLGPVTAAWIVGLGLGAIIIAHLPLGFRLRVGLLLAYAALLTLMRAEVLKAPFTSVVWPILGSMMMFRLIVYMYDLRNKSAPFSPARAVGYFFLLPNVCFPMFPVVDYQTWCRNYYNTDDVKIYQNGIVWIFRGLMQLILYRVIYQNLTVDPMALVDAGTVWQHIIATFGLYFRIIGSFAVAIGVLMLFGFNLPATNHNFLLARNFTEFWQRTNIYWKDFMLKLVFQPVYIVVNRGGNAMRSLGAGLAVTIIVTWFLHSYQWFWIRGSFPVTWQDMAMWGWLGVMMLINMVAETKKPKKRSLKKPPRTVKTEVVRTLKNFALITAVASMWTIVWTSPGWGETREMLKALTNVSLGDVGFFLGTFALFAVGTTIATLLPSENTDINAAAKAKLDPKLFWRRTGGVVLASGAVLAIGFNPAMLGFQPKLADIADRVRDNKLSERDAALLKQGYYEDLSDATRFSPELAALYAARPKDWDTNPLVYQIDGYPDYALEASRSVTFKGAPFTTNRWGMRDRDYEKEKPAGTYRMAMVGQSVEQGSGVRDDQPYEHLIEERLNKERAGTSSAGPQRFEVLNFANGGYGPLHKLAHIEKNILPFSPDAILYVNITDVEWSMNEIIQAHQHKMGLEMIPFPFVHEILKKAGVDNSTPKVLVERQMKPFMPELVAATYKRYAEVCKAKGVRPVLIILAQPEDNVIPEQQEREVQMARDAGLEILEARDIYEGVTDVKKYWIAPWDHHPNVEAHQMIADKIYPRLITLLGL